MQIFPSTVRDLWNIWELRAMVLMSLSLQVVLIPMGFKRKYSSKNWLRWLLWLAYLSADWVATVSLGILSNNDDGDGLNGDSPSRYVIRALWAPFLLLHLGGPDTITAYSMQDNDLWLRHLLGLLVQAGLAFYVFLRALQPTALNFVAIPVFVAGIIKYGERTWVLRSACSQHLRDLLLSVPHFRPKSRNRSLRFPLRIFGEVTVWNNLTEQGPHFSDLGMLHIAHCFFERNKRLFADLVLSSYDLEQSLYYFKKFDSKSAFKVIELELGFMYDFFYTKAFVIHSHWGAGLRLTSLSSIVVAIATFCASKIHRYPLADVCLTFVLLFGALGLEIYSILLLLCSDWCIIWLSQSHNFLAHLTFKTISHSGWSIAKRRWSNSILQYNLISYCLEDKNGGYYKFLRSSYITKTMAASRSISDELKERIFKQLKEKLEVDEESRKLPGWILRKCNYYDKLGWSLELDLDQSILLWHIATDLCYYSNHETKASNNSSVLEDSRSLSDFLTYLLAYRHSLFPNGMGQIRFRATVVDAIDFLQQRKSIETATDACKTMLDMDSRILPTDVKGDGSNSMFYHGCRLAQELRGIEECEKWEIISHVWVEMLVNISCECRWYEHAEQLGHGGDLLTHVWLLMHHLGYRIQVYNLTTMQENSTTSLEF